MKQKKYSRYSVITYGFADEKESCQVRKLFLLKTKRKNLRATWHAFCIKKALRKTYYYKGDSEKKICRKKKKEVASGKEMDKMSLSKDSKNEKLRSLLYRRPQTRIAETKEKQKQRLTRASKQLPFRAARAALIHKS